MLTSYSCLMFFRSRFNSPDNGTTCIAECRKSSLWIQSKQHGKNRIKYRLRMACLDWGKICILYFWDKQMYYFLYFKDANLDNSDLIFFFLNTVSRSTAQAGVHWLFTGMIALPINTDVFTCFISSLGWLTSFLGTLVVPYSQEVTVLMVNLVWIPNQHSSQNSWTHAILLP